MNCYSSPKFGAYFILWCKLRGLYRSTEISKCFLIWKFNKGWKNSNLIKNYRKSACSIVRRIFFLVGVNGHQDTVYEWSQCGPGWRLPGCGKFSKTLKFAKIFASFFENFWNFPIFIKIFEISKITIWIGMPPTLAKFSKKEKKNSKCLRF